MVVQHNMQAMNANRMLNVTTSTQAKSTEKLSSGYKINRAADDAAGLSISENRVTKFYTKDGIFYEYKPLSEIVEELPDNFVRCHAAAIVNMDYVKNYNHSMITMQDGEQIRIGRTYSESFK